MAFPLAPVVLALSGAWLISRSNPKAPAFTPVTAKSGRKWLTRTLGVQGTGPTRKTSVEVWAPAGSYPELAADRLVATYIQTGSDTSARTVLATAPNATTQMITDAGQDFGIRKAA
jgi:hypothetical protein